MQANSGPTLPSSGVVSASPPKIMVALKKSLILHYFVWFDMARNYLWTGRYVLDCPCRPPTVSPKCPCWSQVGLPCVSNAKKYILILNKRSSGKITGFSQLGARLYSNWFILLIIVNHDYQRFHCVACHWYFLVRGLIPHASLSTCFDHFCLWEKKQIIF